MSRSTPENTLVDLRGACRDIASQEGRAGGLSLGSGSAQTPESLPRIPAWACGSRCPPVVPGAAARIAGTGLGCRACGALSRAGVWGTPGHGGPQANGTWAPALPRDPLLGSGDPFLCLRTPCPPGRGVLPLGAQDPHTPWL